MVNSSVYFICELGVNHNGSIDDAQKMIDIAVAYGCNAVKLQHYYLHEVQELEDKEEYWTALKAAQLTPMQLAKLQDYCEGKIDFICSAFGLQSAQDLINLQLPILKIPSGKLTNLEFLRFVRDEFKGFICSTGLTTKEEIELALLELKQGTELKNVALLHCVSAYPCPIDQINLRAMSKLKRLAGKVGVSDHTVGNLVPVVATALGAQIIEKHFTLDKDSPGPDHKISLTPPELMATIQLIRDTEKALGDGRKKIEEAEKIWLTRKQSQS